MVPKKSEIYDPNDDVQHYPEYAGVAHVLSNRLSELWQAWVPSELGIPAPDLCLQVKVSGDAFYGHKDGDDTIYLFLLESDIEEIEAEPRRKKDRITAPGRRTPGIEWSNTTAQLLHETMHAYQYKVLKEPSVEGIELFKTSKARFVGPGHDELFYTSIAMHASYFDLTAEEFAREL